MTSTPKKTGNKQSGFIEKGLGSLAINGGKPVRETPLPYSRHTITEDDKRAVIGALDSDWIAGNGPIVHEFENAIAEYTGYKWAIAVNSATSGLEAACLCFEGFYPFHIPALTFIATANTALDAGYKIKIVDVSEKTLVYDSFWRSVGVSYSGYPVAHTMISDDAHYIYPNMASFKTQRISVLSTHAVKQISTGEGGVILTNEWDLYSRMRQFVDHGRGDGAEFDYGRNYRMPSINAALGLSQLKRERENLEHRQSIAAFYRRQFQDIKWLELPPDHNKHAYHLFVLRTRGVDRDWFRKALEAEGILSQVHYPPLYTYRRLAKYSSVPCNEENYPVSADVWRNGLSIPMFSGMTARDASDVVDAIHKITEYV